MIGVRASDDDDDTVISIAPDFVDRGDHIALFKIKKNVHIKPQK